MTPVLFLLLMFLVSVGAGLLGSLLGLGGGIIVVPALTLGFGVDIRLAIAASIVSVIATSCGGAARYVRMGLANLRLGMVLETATVLGALCGALAFGLVSREALYLIFGLVLTGVSLRMATARDAAGALLTSDREDPMARRLGLSVPNPWTPAIPPYHVARVKTGLGVSYLAGVLSGLLGIGGGVLKVPVMNLAMGVPLKAATATSNLTIGITAAASSAMYLARGDIAPFVAAPVAVGVLTGATLGSFLLPKVHGPWLRRGFVIVLLYVALQMLYRGFAGTEGSP